jgi:hypothetical protein
MEGDDDFYDDDDDDDEDDLDIDIDEVYDDE